MKRLASDCKRNDIERLFVEGPKYIGKTCDLYFLACLLMGSDIGRQTGKHRIILYVGNPQADTPVALDVLWYLVEYYSHSHRDFVVDVCSEVFSCMEACVLSEETDLHGVLKKNKNIIHNLFKTDSNSVFF
ncbi:MAG: uncharacterized protein A8A55_0978 [Amphiamblys sp. WSBS2006]|nr:MAG: uncharacterized protein A8A55_0978 [Amphiamblys sp. WSBS2006]